jgi:hypothetical protein
MRRKKTEMRRRRRRIAVEMGMELSPCGFFSLRVLYGGRRKGVESSVS